ncbi:MAG: hypothetical protein LBQ97_05155 [Fusobacteriaceae bacterium]|jgi:hypothetical protein|nr:hypothetical protein [Fusobacteriaceae bacterium]
MKINIPMLSQLRTLIDKGLDKYSFFMEIFCAIFILNYLILGLGDKKRPPVKVTFRQRSWDEDLGELRHVVSFNVIRDVLGILWQLMFIILFSFSIVSLVFVLFIFFTNFRMMFMRVKIYDNGIVWKSLYRKKTVFFKDVDYMCTAPSAGLLRYATRGYKFCKGTDVVLFLKNMDYRHLSQLEEYFRDNQLWVDKFEEQ